MIPTRALAYASLVILALGSLVAGYGPSTSPASTQQPSAVLAALADSKRVMWLGAHPDDENVVSGLLARAKDVSRELYLVSLTRGENENTRATDPVTGRFTNPWGKPGRVYVTNGSHYFSRPGPRLVDSLEIVAHTLHPEMHPLPNGLPCPVRVNGSVAGTFTPVSEGTA